jgi:MFS family permease
VPAIYAAADLDTVLVVAGSRWVKAPRSRFLINHNFALLWSGQGVSLIGDYLFDTTLIIWIATVIARGQSWAPLAVAGVPIAATLPALLVGPLAGVFVDRWDRRAVMLWADALRLGLTAALALLAAVPAASPLFMLSTIYVVVFLASTAARFFDPARFALIADIVPEGDRARATGLSQVLGNLAGILGPALAAPLFVATGAVWALVLNAVTFLVSYLAIACVQAPTSARGSEEVRPSVRRELGEGFGFVLRHPVLLPMLVAIAVAAFGVAAIVALNVFFITENLHAPLALYGLVGGTLGAGAIAGALGASFVVPKLGNARSFSLALLGAALGALLYPRVDNLGAALVIAFFFGISEGLLNVAFGPLLMANTPRELLGRVGALAGTTNLVAVLGGSALAGFLASTVLRDLDVTVVGAHLGPIDAVLSGAGVLVFIAAAYGIARIGWTDQAPPMGSNGSRVLPSAG